MLVRLRILLTGIVYLLSAGGLLIEVALWICGKTGCGVHDLAFVPAGRLILLALVICVAVVFLGLFLLLLFKDAGRWLAGLVAVIALVAAGLRGSQEWGAMSTPAVLGLVAGIAVPQILVLIYVLGGGFVNDMQSEVVVAAEVARARSSKADGIHAIKLEMLGRAFLMLVFWATYGIAWWVPLAVIPLVWQAWDRIFGGEIRVRGASLTEMVRALIIERRIAGVLTWLIGLAYTGYAMVILGSTVGRWYGWVGGLLGGIVLAQILGVLRPSRHRYELKRKRRLDLSDR